MNQVSRPMQITLVASLLFAAAWFLVLKPKGSSDVAATPVTAPVSTASVASSTPGKTNSALDKTAYSQVGPAKAAAAAASADAHKTENETADSGGSSASTAGKASATKSSVTSSASTSSSATASPATSAAAAASAARKAALAKAASASKTTTTGDTAKLSHADRVILKIKKDLAARKAVVVLVWSKTGAEDRILYKTIKHKIDLRRGKVKTFFIPVAEVGRYDGLLAGLALGQTPSTIVIAPNNEAKVLGGLTSAARIDRLTSSAILTKPTATK